MKSRMIFGIALALCLVSAPAGAFFSTFDTADSLGPGHFQLGLEPQYILTRYPGANYIAHLDMGTPDAGDFKFLMGAGDVTYEVGGFFKYIPFPDYENQPGIGGFFGILYSYKDGNAGLNFRFHPLASKKFKLTDSGGNITPYVSIPLGISTTAGTTTYPTQLAFGIKWLPGSLKNLHLWAEAGLELNQAFSYISTGVTVPFESGNGIQIN